MFVVILSEFLILPLHDFILQDLILDDVIGCLLGMREVEWVVVVLPLWRFLIGSWRDTALTGLPLHENRFLHLFFSTSIIL